MRPPFFYLPSLIDRLSAIRGGPSPTATSLEFGSKASWSRSPAAFHGLFRAHPCLESRSSINARRCGFFLETEQPQHEKHINPLARYSQKIHRDTRPLSSRTIAQCAPLRQALYYQGYCRHADKHKARSLVSSPNCPSSDQPKYEALHLQSRIHHHPSFLCPLGTSDRAHK